MRRAAQGSFQLLGRVDGGLYRAALSPRSNQQLMARFVPLSPPTDS